MSATRLTPAVAQQCLSSNGNDLAKALRDFQVLKANGKLPATYFL